MEKPSKPKKITIVELDLELNGIDRCEGCDPNKRQARINWEVMKDKQVYSSRFWEKKWTKAVRKKLKGVTSKNRCTKLREYWVGDQTKFMKKNQNEKNNNIIYCNLTGTMEIVSPRRKSTLIKRYGSWELVKRHFMNVRSLGLLHAYGPAWLWLQRTPKFIEFKKKIQILLRWYNSSNMTEADYKKLTAKMRPICRSYMVGVTKPIYYKKDGGRVTGVWVKGLPFVYDIFISAESKKAEDIDPVSFEIEKDESDALYRNPSEEEYIIEDPVE